MRRTYFLPSLCPRQVRINQFVVSLPVKVMLGSLPSFVSALLNLAGKLPFFVINLLLTALEPATGEGMNRKG